MNTKTINALILSTDVRLERILLHNNSKNHQFEIRLDNKIDSFESIPKSDAYIYDVELTDKDLISTVSKIHELKQSIGKKPLILIGNKIILRELLNSGSIKEVVTRTINKPISYGQIRLAVESCLLKPTTRNSLNSQKGPSNQRRFVVASLLAAFVLLSTITYFKTKEVPFTNTARHSSIAPTEEKLGLPDNIQPNQRSEKIEQLNQFAISALEEGRLNKPLNNNAIYFLTQLKNLDPYNNTANQTHHKLFQLLEASYLEHSANNNNQETKSALETILEYEPYNHKYAVLLRELDERIYLENNNKSAKNNAVTSNVSNTNSLPVIQSDELTNGAQNITPTIKENTDRINAELTASIDTQSITAPNESKSTNQTIKDEENSLIEKIQDSESILEDKTDNTLDIDTDNLVASINPDIDITPESTISKVEIIKRSEPYYPKLAEEFNYEGWIELEYQVDTDGKATNIKVIDGEKVKTFGNSAIKALKEWEFSPALDSANNLPQMSERMTTSFNFKLN